MISFVEGGPTLKKQPLLGAWLQAGWSVSEKIPTNKNFLPHIPGLGADVLHPLKVPPPGTAYPNVL